jgi:hypothetical protein
MKKIEPLRVCVVCAVLLASSIQCAFGASIADIVTGGAALRSVLQEFVNAIDSVIQAADAATAAKLHSARNDAEDIIQSLSGLEGKTAGDAEALLGSAAQKTEKLLSDVHSTVHVSEKALLGDVDATMISVSQIVDALPFTNVQPYVVSLKPGRILAGNMPQVIEVYGFLPGVPGKDVTASISGVTVDVKRGERGSLQLAWPKGIAAKQGAFIPVDVIVRKPGSFFDWFTTPITISDRLYVALERPFSCTSELFRANPAATVEIKATSVFHAEANTQGGTNVPSLIDNVTGRELFVGTVPNHDQFDQGSVTIKSSGELPPGLYGACSAIQPSAKVTTWDSGTVHYSLSAPKIGVHTENYTCEKTVSAFGHVIKRIYWGCTRVSTGHGTHAVLNLQPTFTAQKKGVPPTTLTASTAFQLGQESYKQDNAVPADKDWQIQLVCRFLDGDEKWDTGPLIMNSTVNAATNRGVAAVVEDNRLWVQVSDWVTDEATKH